MPHGILSYSTGRSHSFRLPRSVSISADQRSVHSALALRHFLAIFFSPFVIPAPPKKPPSGPKREVEIPHSKCYTGVSYLRLATVVCAARPCCLTMQCILFHTTPREGWSPNSSLPPRIFLSYLFLSSHRKLENRDLVDQQPAKQNQAGNSREIGNLRTCRPTPFLSPKDLPHGPSFRGLRALRSP
jgi:hypothetical protein